MTALSIVQAVAEEVNLPTVAGITGVTNENVKQIVRALNNEGRYLTISYDWTTLQAEHTFSTVADSDSYVLPSDFQRMIGNTLWNRSDNWQVRGPASPQEWQYRKSGLVNTSIRDRYRLKGSANSRFFIEPTPSAVETIAFEYISKNWAVDGVTEAAADSVSQDSDTVLFDEYLMQLGATWRWLKSKGFPYAEERAEYDRVLSTLQGTDRGGPRILRMDNVRNDTPIALMPDSIPTS